MPCLYKRQEAAAMLPREFYQRPTLEVAKDLLGKQLVHRSPEGVTAGIIVETEAYVGTEDPACHAAKGRRPFCETMWAEAGRAYIYRTHGRYHCLNVVTERAEFPAAALIRAIEPTLGLDLMLRRRGIDQIRLLTSGPSRLCIAMGLSRELDGLDLTGERLFVEDAGIEVARVERSGRIGISSGQDRPWRFFVVGNQFVSRGRGTECFGVRSGSS
jgi:DNA-3-methyladenine glycosylase